MSCGCNSIGDSKNEVVASDIDGPSARFKRRVVVAVMYSLRSYKRFPNQTMIRIDKFVANTAVLTKQAFTLSCLYSAWA